MSNMQQAGIAPPQASEQPGYTLWQLALYFLRLGTFGFGGPVALAGPVIIAGAALIGLAAYPVLHH